MDTFSRSNILGPFIYLNTTGRKGGRESEREKETDRQTEIETERKREKQKQRDIQFRTVECTLATCSSSSILVNSRAGNRQNFWFPGQHTHTYMYRHLYFLHLLLLVCLLQTWLTSGVHNFNLCLNVQNVLLHVHGVSNVHNSPMTDLHACFKMWHLGMRSRS